MGNKPLGVYIHIPFCAGKCPYCDFYSIAGEDRLFDKYTNAVELSLKRKLSSLGRDVDTVYFGGGTPSLIGGRRITKILEAAKAYIKNNAEITVECNPSSVDEDFFQCISSAGVNRISMGMQSAVDDERLALGRKASAKKVESAVELAKKSGIKNISLDLMIGIPKQTLVTLKKSIDFCGLCDVTHVSAYILKIEDNTPFGLIKDKLILPDEDEQCELYLETCMQLEKYGFMQYEISNFSKPGNESRHNLKYWNCEEYLGIGCAAHSFIDGKRFYYERDLDKYCGGCEPICDGNGGDLSEFIMLALRLVKGVSFENVKERFGVDVSDVVTKTSKKFMRQGLLTCDEKGVRLNSKGFLVSNAIIFELNDKIENMLKSIK